MKYLALIPLLFAVSAWGQDAGDEWIIGSADIRLNEVFVEGIYDSQKDEQDIAGAIDIVDRESLETISLVHPAEALNRVAGLNIHRGSGQEHLTAIRSPVLTGGAGAGSFLYLEDGVPLRAAGFANVNGLFEAGTEFANKLEIFKGPGPAFYGSNAVHGLINVQSADVNSVNRVKVMGSNDGLLSAQAAMTQSNIRASLSLVSDNGFREDSGFDQQKFQLKYQNDFGPWSVEWLSSLNNLNQETAGFIQGDDAFRDDNIRFTNPNPEAFRDGKSYRTQVRFERDLDDGKTLALTPYARRAELRFLRHFVPGQALEKNGHSSVGLQSAYYDDSFNIGADAEYTKGFLYEFQENPSRFSFVQGLHYDYEVESFVGAIYAQKDIRLADNVILDIGARAEYTDYNYDNNASDGRSGRFIRVADRSDDFLTITPKASLRYYLDNGNMIYARAARGSRAPQVTDLYSVQLTQVAGEADVETLDSLEAGFKGGFRNFDVELAAFTMWKDNFFFRNANGFNVVNGKTRHNGVELSFTGDITDWLSVSGDGTLAKHTYNFTETVGSAANNITAGDRVDTAPDTLAHIRATARPIDKLEAEIEWRHVGSYFTNPGNTEKYPGHDIFVLRGRYDVSDAITFFGRVDNLFDMRYADRADFAFGNERYFPGRPRTMFFGLSSEF
ncbi:TonB-dependent receptor [Hellea balneolensis]|uniref:TonB-dependent receptor n=1 Tax=Hellea balneolensis TaxID=287478 RepID=UPI0004182B73|nr:TonB-dependent receptor [Hellea balneolensis]